MLCIYFISSRISVARRRDFHALEVCVSRGGICEEAAK
jgi:hypothetical protein